MKGRLMHLHAKVGRRSGSLKHSMMMGALIGAGIVSVGSATVKAASPLGTPFSQLSPPAGAPAWFSPSWHALLNAPLPSVIGPTPGMPAVVPQSTTDTDPTGLTGTFQPTGPTATATNAFFQPLGTNGRACVTCHLPANGMGLSLGTITSQYKTYGVNNPLFAPVDGATCPKNVAATYKSRSPIGVAVAPTAWPTVSPYYTLLTKGLFRIPLPVPANADFTIKIVDPYGCNTDPQYAQVTDPKTGIVSQVVSVYRRPLMAANLKFKTITYADSNTAIGQALSVGLAHDTAADIALGNPPLESGNIMWDGREPTLQSQATDATLGHAQALNAPTAAQIAQIVNFENGIFSAQIYDNLAQISLNAGVLSGGTAFGGPVTVANTAPGIDPPAGSGPTFALYSLKSLSVATSADAQRASVVRGQTIFNTRTFTVSNVAGLNDAPGLPPGPLTTACSGCHRQTNAGTDDVPNGQHDIGVSGTSVAFGGPPPATDLPIFTIVCKAGATTSFHGSTIVTNDPGKALITGKCADVGRFTVPGLRALASRAPYFHDGSAATLMDVVNFYNARFHIALSPQDKQDLVNFLNTL